MTSRKRASGRPQIEALAVLLLSLLGFVPILLPLARAAVTGIAADVEVGRGRMVVANMRLTAGGPVTAIGGELTYDPSLLANPFVDQGPGAWGYTVLGHISDPGGGPIPARFRFVLYKKTADANLDLTQPVIQFRFDVLAYGDKTTQVQFSESVAARVVSESPLTVVSIAWGGPGGAPAPETVTFRPFSVHIPTAVANWHLYE